MNPAFCLLVGEENLAYDLHCVEVGASSFFQGEGLEVTFPLKKYG